MENRNILNKQTKKILQLIDEHCKEMNIFNIEISLHGGINVLCAFDSLTVRKLIDLKFTGEIQDSGFLKLKRNILTITLT